MLEYIKYLIIGIGFVPFDWKLQCFIEDKAIYFWIGPFMGTIGSDRNS